MSKHRDICFEEDLKKIVQKHACEHTAGGSLAKGQSKCSCLKVCLDCDNAVRDGRLPFQCSCTQFTI